MSAPMLEPTLRAREMLERYKFSDPELQKIVGAVAEKTMAGLIMATPVRFEGQVRKQWNTLNPGPQPDGSAVRIIGNSATAKNGVQILFYLEKGTANGGEDFIYPKTAKYLYIPLTRRAAGGWRKGLKFGVDYVLKKRVRGSRAQHIVENELPKVKERLRQEFLRTIDRIFKLEDVNA